MKRDTPPDAEHNMLRAILQNAVDAIVTIDARGIVASANPATERLFQYSETEIVGKNVSILMPSPFRESHDDYLANYLATGEAKIIGIGREVVGQRKDGTTFPMHLAVSETTAGEDRMFTGIVRDISDVKHAEQELARLNEELEVRVAQRTAELEAVQAELLAKEALATLGQVSGSIAHEIRNPLNAIKTSSYYLLNAKNATEEKQREYLERIDRQVTIIDNVITALSDVAKMPEAKKVPIHCRDLVESVVSQVALPPEITVQITIPMEVPPILADQHQIPLVFQNLIRNARDAMSSGGRITVTAAHSNDRVTVRVADTGSGIENAIIGRIMEPLFSTKARGMGLGLSICKAIVEKNDGDITVESEVGEGSTFTVTLKASSPRE